SGLIDEVIEYADAKGIVLCAASGNSGAEEVNYPAGYDVTIAIGASNDSDRVTSFSTYGDHISVCAPGLSILSLRADLTDMYASSYPREPGVHIVDSLYYMASGTSMACPHVVGVASWIRSVSPGLIPARVKEIIEQSADDIVDPFGIGWNLPGFDKYSGYGRLNLKKALDITPRRRAKIVFPANNAIDSGYIVVHGHADGDDFTGWTLDYGAGDSPTSWINLASLDEPVTNNAFTSWDTHGLTGQFTLRLTVDEENISYVTLYIAGKAAAEIRTPSDGETISNFAAVHGDAYCPDFSSYKLEYLVDTSGAEWERLSGGTVPIFDDVLGGWFLEEMSETDYSLRVTIYANGVPVMSDSISVTVQSIFSTEQAWRSHLNGYPGIISNYGDFDGDGYNEIIIGTSSGIEVFNTDGTVKLDNLPDFPVNNFLMPIAVGNLDGDNIDDIVAVGYDPPFVYGFPSSAPPFKAYTGIFPQLYNFYRSEHEFPKVALKDIDHDGLDEIYVFMSGSSLSSTFLFESDGEPINSFDYFAETFLVDLDGDGTDELYAANQTFCLLRQIDCRTGITMDSLLIQKNGADFRCLGMSAYDIDNDEQYELILYGFYLDDTYWIYAFDDGLQLIDGWPHEIGLDDFVVPTAPVFGDLDGDGEPEYVSSFFDLDASYVLAWNLDGTSFLSGSQAGLFAVTPKPSVLNMLLLADIDGDNSTDIIACANNDLFNTYKAQRIYAWNNEADILPGFPMVTVQNAFNSDRITPSVGDIDNDGNIELIMPVPDSNQIYVNYPYPYNRCQSPAPFWRYNRRMNNVAALSCQTTDVDDWDEITLPHGYSLSQNYPNPFNPTT
ncbi:MAG: S8 family serine peptidase, partial [candidate division Zixibacteria bacterium]|nr:S8 family serine peptidase [candidate division Zixibacteria bacterium]